MYTALKAIKLSGFKSFVDPTSLHFKHAKTGVVGPNGCGKSNIVDAIRWVVGESSAKQLRGQAMSDVIFNGTVNRKPVGQASVELIFDNQNGRINKGEYGKYSEISLKRTLGRDQQSVYCINGIRSRRRDIIDLLRGTGLGPRNYAIIEQGTVSRVIEAKPDELRVYIEEVAGTAQYKDRRRETENRMRATRENLERMLDIQQELDKQLRHLKKQANAAERYKDLKESLRTLKAEHEVLAWRKYNDEHAQRKAQLVEHETSLAKAESSFVSAEREETELSQERQASSDALQAHQKSFYTLGAELAQLEEKLKSMRMHKQSVQSQLDELQDQRTHQDDQLHDHRSQCEQIASTLSGLEGSVAEAKAELAKATEILAAKEQDLNAWQDDWLQFTESSSGAQQTVTVMTSQLEDIGRQKSSMQHQIDQAEQALPGCDSSVLNRDITALNEQIEGVAQGLSKLLTEIEQDQQRRQALKQAQQEKQKQLVALQENRSNDVAKLASLEALQQAAKGQDNDDHEAWLTRQGWQDYKRVMDQLDVEPKWERAVETVLGPHLEAICADQDLQTMATSVKDWTGKNIVIHAASKAANETPAADSLQSKIKQGAWASHLLGLVYVAETLEEALIRVQTLSAHESVILPNGLWLGPGWLKMHASTQLHHGVLERKRSIAELQAAIEKDSTAIEGLQQALDQVVADIEAIEARAITLAEQQQQHQAQSAELRAKYVSLSAQAEQKKADHARFTEQLNTANAQLVRLQEREEECQDLRAQAVESQQSYASNKQVLESKREDIQAALQQARASHQQQKGELDQYQIQWQSLLSERDYLNKRIAQDEQAFSHTDGRLERLSGELDHADAPIETLEQSIQELAEQHGQKETTMAQLQAALGESEHTLQQCIQQKRSFEQTIASTRAKAESHRLALQTIMVHRDTHQKNIMASGFELDALNQALAADANIEAWAENITTQEKRIERLGPINLAAIDEYSQISERKEYLDQQQNDLESALGILENAIAKIDQETRSMFKATYDKVNEGFMRIFPQIFSGGKASLEMTENNYLQAGIVVKAQPPGKRNNSIHLLSGGEKALTAIALVFALFEANPAPFCVLDEVDAPLDEVNVGRFCRIVESMAKAVQFIVITHNKATMQHMDQLNGVTMREAGVTRMVSVDIAEAVELVE